MVSAPGLDERTEKGLVRLLFARLALTVLAFGTAVGLDGLGQALAEDARVGLYLTVAAAFASTIFSAATLAYVRRPALYASAQLAIDVGIVTSLVHYSGGRESIFTFLYVVVTLYGSGLFERRGAIVSATLSALAYGVILFGGRLGLFPRLVEDGELLPIAVLGAIWGVHVGALYLVGVLSSLLSAELMRTGAALDQSTSDLRQLRDLHRLTIESIMSGLLTIDQEGRVTSFNPEAERITGRSRDEVHGEPLESVIPGAGAVLDASNEGERGAPNGRGRIAYSNSRGEELYLGLASSVLKGPDEAPAGHIVIFQDVTKVVAMERELRQSERLAAVGEMAAKIAHEIRNPLASISGSVQILGATVDWEATDRESRQLLDIVVREADRLNVLISDFLQYSRPNPPKASRVDLGELILDVAKMLESTESAGPEGVRVRCETRGGTFCVSGDADQLRQVVWNLAINGIQAMEDGGILTLGLRAGMHGLTQDGGVARRNGDQRASGRTPDAEERSPHVEIVVRDQGPGISDEIRERIFEPFFTTKQMGTGLGLAMVHRIVEVHGGALSVESEMGTGTTFRVILPSMQERE